MLLVFFIFFIYLFIAIIFLFNALAFIPLGHLVARLMYKTNSLKAYSYDLIGAIAGICLFTILSFLWTGPTIWLVISFSTLIFIQYNLKLNIKFSCITFVILILTLNLFNNPSKLDLHSPYQNVSVKFNNNEAIPITVQSNNMATNTYKFIK